MISIFRKHQQWLMYLITFLVIISFIWFYNRTNLGERSAEDVIWKVYDRNYSRHEAQRLARRLSLAQELFMIDIMQHLMGYDTQHVIENLIVLRHEADVLGVQPTDEQVMTSLKTMPPFETNGTFDPQKYALFLNDRLPSLGFTEADLEELVRDQLRLKKLKEIIDSTVIAAPADIRVYYELENQKAQLSIVRFKHTDFVAAVRVSDEEVKKRFELQKENLKSEEKRKIKFVEFAMNETEKKLAGKERAPVLEKLKIQAEQFAQEMTGKDAKFDDAAKKLGAIVHETQLFTRAKPDAQIAKSPAIVADAFRRTKEDANSDPQRFADGFIVLQLIETAPSKPLTLDEAKPQIAEQIKNELALEAMNTKAAEARKKIDAGLQAGKSFADAATAAGVKAEQIAAFSHAEPNKDMPDAMDLLVRSFEMAEGQMSEFMPDDGGGVLIHLDKRLPIDETKFEKEKPRLSEMILQQRREMAFQEWLRTRRESAKFLLTQSQN